MVMRTGTVTPHSKFKAEVYILKRKRWPPRRFYAYAVLLRTTDVTGEIRWMQAARW